MRFDYYNPVKIITGTGCVSQNAQEFSRLGRACLIVTSGTAAQKSGALKDVLAALQSQNITHTLFDAVEQNPSVDTCKRAGDLARAAGVDFLVGIGGGSPLDATKAAAVYAANPMDAMDIYKLDWKNPALPFILIGTTAGTGSEVTSFSILTMRDGRKKSIAHEQCYPRLMLGDARYTASLPLAFTISTAVDALAHALEGYFSAAANDMTDLYAMEAVALLCPQLRLLQNTDDAAKITFEQREVLYKASIIAGLTLSQCGTLYCHALGYYFTEQHQIPHGIACAATLGDLIMRGAKFAPGKANRLFAYANTSAAELYGLIDSFCGDLPLSIPKEDISRIAAENAKTKNFAKTLPNGFTEQDAIALLTQDFGDLDE